MANSNQEIIEARLATYVDGELDAAERMEIETHLEQNPQYRRMVEELRLGRELLRGLPREAAPPELAEAFTSQLERSVLLDGGGEPEQPRMRIGAWQHVFAAAAIVFLTLGLATIVYYVLPGHGKVVATGNPSTRSTTSNGNAESSSPDPSDEKTVIGGVAGNGKDGSHPDDTQPAAPAVSLSSNASSPVPNESVAADRPGRGAGAAVRKDGLEQNTVAKREASNARLDESRKNELEQLAAKASQEREVIDLLAAAPAESSKGGKALSIGDRAVLLYVRSSDPQQVDKALNEYRRNRNIDLQPTPETVLALNDSVNPQSDRSLFKAALDKAALDAEADTKASESARKLQDEKKPGEAASAAAAPPAPGATVPALAAAQPKPTSGEQSAKGAPPASMRPKTAAVQIGQAGGDAPVAPRAGIPVSQPVAPFAKPLDEKQGIKFQLDTRGKQLMYVARRLSRQDAQALNACLARTGEVSEAAIVRPLNANLALGNADPSNREFRYKESAPAPTALQDRDALAKSDLAQAQEQKSRGHVQGPASEPADSVVEKGDQLRLRYPPGKDAAERAESVLVKADGTIEPQLLAEGKGKPVQVAGKKLSEVEKSLEQNSTEGAARTGPALAPVKVSILSQDDEIAHAPQAPSANKNGASTAFGAGAGTTSVPGSIGKTATEIATQPAALEALKDARARRSAGSPAAPGIAPGNPTTGPSGSNAELVDVVIVVQSDPMPAESSPVAPATTITPAQAPVPATAPAMQPGVSAPQTPAAPGK